MSFTVEVSLTAMEERVMLAYAEGMTITEVARILGMSPQTAKNHISSVHRKLDVDSSIGAMRVLGWLRPPEGTDDYQQCGVLMRCGRPWGHRGHHGGFRHSPMTALNA
jgi:DNA-binding CsgD family transcriptional regulator